MKVSVWYNNRDIRLEDRPRPEPGAAEMLVKVISSGICGSDLVEWYRLPRAPLVQGHEIGGQVIEVGSAVHKYKPGDRVFIAPKVPCMKCYYCKKGNYPVCSEVKDRLPGGFAEYVLVPKPLVETGTYILPENISFDQGTFIEPLACVVRATNLAGLREDKSVLIMGSGMSGLLFTKLARLRGCRIVVTDVDTKRLELAQRMGADHTLLADEHIHEQLIALHAKKANVVVLCTSALSAVAQAWKCVDRGGVIVFFAVPGPDEQVTLPINDFWRKEIRIITSYYCGPPDIIEAIRLLESEEINVDDLITHRLPLKDIAEGFKLVSEGGESLKIIIKPHSYF
ncbi:MAG: alcohol dehydrogenase catalytic domain-containing protein [Candidatus Aminicenantes bacterium]|nr:alcohol dehydrogenase catalytic domain-containing protein [Candidatus Aminicenantes bacterium]